jgi:hypothetical protein
MLVRSSKLRIAALAAAAGIMGLATPGTSSAALYMLESNNSVVDINPFGDSSEPDGLYNWTVDGATQAREQGYWFQIGGTGPTNNVATLSPSALSQPVQLLNTSGESNAAPNEASINYQGSGFTINTRYQLTGGANGSNLSDLVETVVINNTGTSALKIHMDDYTDLNLGGNGANDSISITNGGATATQTNPTGWTGVATGSTTNLASFDAAAYPTLLNAVNAGTFPLNEQSSLTDQDVTNGVEYDATLAPNVSMEFTVNQEILGPAVGAIVPEPTMIALAASCLFMIRPRRRECVVATGV